MKKLSYSLAIGSIFILLSSCGASNTNASNSLIDNASSISKEGEEKTSSEPSLSSLLPYNEVSKETFSYYFDPFKVLCESNFKVELAITSKEAETTCLLEFDNGNIFYAIGDDSNLVPTYMHITPKEDNIDASFLTSDGTTYLNLVDIEPSKVLTQLMYPSLVYEDLVYDSSSSLYVLEEESLSYPSISSGEVLFSSIEIGFQGNFPVYLSYKLVSNGSEFVVSGTYRDFGTTRVEMPVEQ